MFGTLGLADKTEADPVDISASSSTRSILSWEVAMCLLIWSRRSGPKRDEISEPRTTVNEHQRFTGKLDCSDTASNTSTQEPNR
jgi:hypothetical protein